MMLDRIKEISATAKARRTERRSEAQEQRVRSPALGSVPAFSIKKAVEVQEGCLRNHAITFSYQWLGERLAESLGRQEVNWCTFAAWASRTVGYVLDDYELPILIERRIHRYPKFVHTAALFLYRNGRRVAFYQNRPSLVAGNTAVFDDIGRRFMDLIPFLGPEGAQKSDAAFESFIQSFAAPPDRHDLAAQIGDLREAFRLYRRASVLPVSVERAEITLVATALVGSYEQMLLQPAIELALFSRPSPGVLRRVGHRVVPRALTKVMAVYTPNRVLRIAWKRIPLPGSRVLVDRYQARTHEAQNLFGRYPVKSDRQPEVRSWAAYEQRMKWIVEYFRLHHADDSFFESPFSYSDAELQSEIQQILMDAVERFGIGASAEDRSRTEGYSSAAFAGASPEMLPSESAAVALAD